MGTLMRYEARNMLVDLADLPTWLYDELASLRGQINRGDPPVLTCMGNGEPMYIYRHETGRYYAKHFPNGAGASHSHALSKMSDEHRRQCDYTLRAAVDNGISGSLERSTGNGTRLDVALSGRVDIGVEIQRSSLSKVAARQRASKSFDAGWPTMWVTDHADDPNWADWVPTIRLTTRGGWDHQLPMPNTAYVSIGNYSRERDKSSRTGWRYRREPKAVLLDEVAALSPLGKIVPIRVGSVGRVDVSFAESAEVVDSCTFPGAAKWTPCGETTEHKQAAQWYTIGCHGASTAGISTSSNLREHFPACTRCGGFVAHPESVRTGICAGCRKGEKP